MRQTACEKNLDFGILSGGVPTDPPTIYEHPCAGTEPTFTASNMPIDALHTQPIQELTIGKVKHRKIQIQH